MKHKNKYLLTRNFSRSFPVRFGPEIVVAFSAIIFSALHLPLTVFPIARDQGVWLAAAKSMAAGKTFFTDFLHFNLPGAGFAYRAALLFVNDPAMAPILVSVINGILIIFSFYLLLGKGYTKWAGAWASLAFAILWPTKIGWWNIAQKDFLAIPWIFFATWCALLAKPGKKYSRLFIIASGALTAIASQFKPIYILVGFLLVLGFAIRRLLLKKEKTATGSKILFLIEDSLLFTLGGLIGFLPLFIHLVLGGGLTDAYYCLTSLGPAYMSVAKKSFISLFHSWSRKQTHNSFLFISSYGGIVIFLFSTSFKKRFWIAAPALVFLAGYFIQGKGMGYHAQPWLVTLFLFAGIFLDQTFKMGNYFPFRKTSVPLVAVSLVLLYFFALSLNYTFTRSKYVRAELPVYMGKRSAGSYYKKFFRYRKGHPNPAISLKVARWIKKHSRPEDTVVIWGNECQIYVLANRNFATQVPFDQMLTSKMTKGSKGESYVKKQRKIFLKRLEIEKPKFFLVTMGDINPVEPIPSNKSLKLVPGLKKYLKKNYTLVKKIERFRILKRN